MSMLELMSEYMPDILKNIFLREHVSPLMAAQMPERMPKRTMSDHFPEHFPAIMLDSMPKRHAAG